MIKTALVTALLGLAMVAPSYAQDKFACDEASMTKMKTDIDGLTDAAKKDAAMKEYDLAMAAMKEKKMDECSMHGGEAGKNMR